MPADTITYISDAHGWGVFSSTTMWQLTPEGLLRTSKKGNNQLYPYTTIDHIRLHFHIGRRTTPSRYCCYFSVKGKASLSYLISITKEESKKEKGKEYAEFVKAFIEKVKQASPGFKLLFGYSRFMWWFNVSLLVLSLSVLALAGLYNYHEAALDRKGGVVFLLLLSVFFIAFFLFLRRLVQFYPRELPLHEPLPWSVVPEENEPAFD